MTSEEKMRKEFEEWAAPNGISITRTNQAMCFANGRRLAVGDYILLESQIAYAAWKACRKSLDVKIEEMVNRFLSWPLPDSVCADGCAKIPGYPLRHGTNLLTAEEAKLMLEYVLKGDTK